LSFLIVSAAIGAGSALYGVGKSISQSAQANKIDKNNQRGTYTIPDEYKQNLAMAKNMAQVGLPQQQYNNQLNGIQRNQAGGLGALAKSANPGANLASIVRQGNDALGNLNARDAQARTDNQRYEIGINGQMGQQKLAQQQYDKFDKYTENYNRSAALRGAAGQNMQNAVNGASGMASNLYALNQGVGGGGNTPETGNDFNYTSYHAPQTQQFGQSFGYGSNYSPIGWGGQASQTPKYQYQDINYIPRR
jgi:hypothetical protein